jgi:hypothetical protein
VRVYRSNGWVVGFDPPAPVDEGPLVGNSLLRIDRFAAPPGTVQMDVVASFLLGAGSGGVRVVHESGLVVFRHEYLVNAHDGGWGGCIRGLCTYDIHAVGEKWTAETAPPGNYTVEYRFVGAVYANVGVDALVEA